MPFHIDGGVVESRPLGVSNVGACGFFSLIRSALFNCVHDFSMLFVGTSAFRHPERRVVQQRKRIEQQIQRLHQILIVCRMINDLVKLTIEHDQLHGVFVGLPEFPLQPGQMGHLSLGRPLGGEPRC